MWDDWASQVIKILVISLVIVLIHEGFNTGFKILEKQVVFEQNAVLKYLCQRSVLSWVSG